MRPVHPALRAYVRVVEAVSRAVGRFAMLMVFAMMGVLLYSAFSKALLLPALWTLETAQFLMVAYFLLGGGYAIQLGAHVRMDLLYGRWSPRTKARADSVTAVLLMAYLALLVYGGISSSQYAVEYGERSYSSWAPPMAPIKIIMTCGALLTLLQASATFIRDFAAARGREI